MQKQQQQQQKQAINSFTDFCSRGLISQRANTRSEAAFAEVHDTGLAFSFHSASHARGANKCAGIIHHQHLSRIHTHRYIMQNRKTYILRCGCDEMCLRLARHAARTPKERKEPSAATFYLILRLILLLSR